MSRYYSLLDVRFSLRQAIATVIALPLVLAVIWLLIVVYVAVGSPA